MRTSNNSSSPALNALLRIYRLYDDYINSFSLACRKHCADCCTMAVTMTSLEGRMIYDFAGPGKSHTIFEKAFSCADIPRFQPAMSTNCYARLCSGHVEPPEEKFPNDPGQCPLLEEDVCSIYPVRPFACRSMISSEPCRRTGSALMDDLTFTVNTMFLQIIENLDRQGFFGNLIDVLLRVANSENAATDPQQSNFVSPDLISTVPNEPIPALMIPSEHHKKVLPLLNTLDHILKEVPGNSGNSL